MTNTEILTSLFLTTDLKLRGISVGATILSIRIGYHNRKPIHAKSITISKYPKLETLVAEAVIFRTESIEKLRVVGYDPNAYRYTGKMRVTNTSGTNRLSRRRSTTKHGEYYAWQASWIDDIGKPNSVGFSIDKWGEQIAKQRALDCLAVKKNIYRVVNNE